MKKLILFYALGLLVGCSSRDKYDVSHYYDLREQDQIITNIVTYIFDAPPGTKLKDRFDKENRTYYSALTSRFSINKYFIAEDGTHYFYVIRPGPSNDEMRGVGGHFKMKENFELKDFREEFVTPLLPESEVKGRCAFLYDEMLKHNLGEYLKMSSYVQWPSAITYYDTIVYQWQLKPGVQ